MGYCANLTSPPFAGLGVLASVGDLWMHDCGDSTARSFAELGIQTSVGSYWMKVDAMANFLPTQTTYKQAHKSRSTWVLLLHTKSSIQTVLQII